MEGLHSRLTTGELPGGQEHPSHPASPHGDPQPKSPSTRQPRQQHAPPQKPHGKTRQTKQSRRTHPQRKRLKHQQQSIESDTMTEGNHAEEATETATETTTTTTAAAVAAAVAAATTAKITSKVTRVPCPSSGVPVCSAAGSILAEQEGTPKLKRERKPQRPGKYVCSYCGRACAKPSVLQKHIRSHTGERPYPCAPCGFSFKTKSNLYKHRKSHTHRVKAGLAFSEPRSLEEQATESEDEAKQMPSSASGMEHQSSTTSAKSHESDGIKDSSRGMDDSYAVKKRLAMRLSRGKRSPLDSSDERVSSSLLGSRGSTESGYFSRSESTEQSQDSPPNTSAKSYAEIILGKYGRFGHLQRMSRHQNQQISGEEEKNIPFTVPKKQVIDHITKLITINEAVVDTSKIDSVKPRRFSLSRKSSSESQKSINIKEPILNNPKSEEPSYKNSGSITMGVPCEKFQHQSLKLDPLAPHTSAGPLLRSQSMPFATSSLDASSNSPPRFRQSQSFEQPTPSQLQTSRRFGMLRRQPAIEIPLSSELPKEDHCSFHSFHQENLKTTVPDHKPTRLQPYKSEACGTECKTWEGYKTHKQSICSAQSYGNVSVSITHKKDHPQVIIHPIRPGAQAMRKRRKEESFESDDPSSPVACSSPSHTFSAPLQCTEESGVAHEDTRRPKPHTLSVIQHTSSFEKQDTLCTENIRKESTNISPTRQDYQTACHKPPQQQHPTESTPQNLVHQHNMRVPEILVTDSNMDTQSSSKATPTSKQPEKLEEFQWPQRSPTLAQLPIEKLPPKKKRLRLAEIAQSSGDPSQDSSTSHASSRSASFEESGRVDLEVTSATPLRRSRASHLLTVPRVHQHREMRRSVSEQAPHDPQQGVLMSENRSKSFDYSCLSPERSAVGWRERRKCLLLKHSAVRDPEEEEEGGAGSEVIMPSTHLVSGLVSASTSSDMSSSAVNRSTTVVTSPLSDDRVCSTPTRSPHQELFPQWKISQNIQLTGRSDLTLVDGRTVGPASEGSTQDIPWAFPRDASNPIQEHRLEIPTQTNREFSRVQASSLPVPIHSLPSITINPELLRPLTSPAVAVRLQADTLLPACAIYTTQSQTAPVRSSLQPMGIATHSASISLSTHQGCSSAGSEYRDWSEDPLRLSGTGGNKRMLSPSNSVEFSLECQQQQKRVKEEEEERGVEDEASAEAGSEREEDNSRRRPSVCLPVEQMGVSLQSLESGTCNSWCYLNYMKPNPFALDERRSSVYSSWSTGSYNPNPLGLSSGTALSLLQCKQSLGPTVYTTSPMGNGSVETIRAEDHQRPASTEVSSSLSCDKEYASTRNEALSAEDRSSNKGDKEEEEGPNQANVKEENQSSAKYRHPSQPWTCSEGSSGQPRLAYARGEQGICEGPPLFDQHDEKPEESQHHPLQESTGTFHSNNTNEEDDDGDNNADLKGCQGVPSASPTNQSAGEPVGRASGSLTQTPSAGSRRALFARLRLPPPPPQTPPPTTPPPRTTPSPDRLPPTRARSPPGLHHRRSPPISTTVSPATSPGLQISPSPVGGASPCGGHSLNCSSMTGQPNPPLPPPRHAAPPFAPADVPGAPEPPPPPLPAAGRGGFSQSHHRHRGDPHDPASTPPSVPPCVRQPPASTLTPGVTRARDHAGRPATPPIARHNSDAWR
ncbi:Transcription factor HIVEP3 [Merluccius polli]|uniref:Transcription factor HIVEP3 n=1 Tax=Merluccius polli TaxID=89951 RepID=A0AA47MD34_MERPO|nr:Transcription factor HIVEP3 [Merluccius polli]